MAEHVVGRVGRIWVYPVKSLAGTAASTVRIEPGGLVGDRAHVVVDDAGRPLRAKDVPALATVSSADADDAALSAALGRTVRLEPAGVAASAAPVHLVSQQAIDRAVLGDVPDGCSAEDPRANLLLDLDDGADERAWVGRSVQVGDVVLEIVRTPKHCLGVYAEVGQAGTVSVGDAVLI